MCGNLFFCSFATDMGNVGLVHTAMMGIKHCRVERFGFVAYLPDDSTKKYSVTCQVPRLQNLMYVLKSDS